jgi:hypothetical protein
MTNIDNELMLCKYLLSKYSDIINEREKRTIGEIKSLVDGKDLTIQSFVEDFKPQGYSFKQDYESALKKAFDAIKEEISFVDAELNVNYWLTPKEIIEAKVADDEDLAVFMCASMKALGDNKAEVIIAELDDLRTHAFVLSEINGETIILDPAQEHAFEEFKGNKIDVIKKYSFQKKKIKRFLYRFNYEKYEQFLE